MMGLEICFNGEIWIIIPVTPSYPELCVTCVANNESGWVELVLKGCEKCLSLKIYFYPVTDYVAVVSDIEEE